jgi:hypothetical protein
MILMPNQGHWEHFPDRNVKDTQSWGRKEAGM